jgi:predicted RNA binding protein YcfA (HicA-like mRNA interferase family)
MPKIAPVSWKKLVKFLKKNGFKQERTKGSHIVLVKPGLARPLVVPKYKSLGLTIVKNNLKTSGLSEAEFAKFLGRE